MEGGDIKGRGKYKASGVVLCAKKTFCFLLELILK
jgi:hypothetical protein